MKPSLKTNPSTFKKDPAILKLELPVKITFPLVSADKTIESVSVPCPSFSWSKTAPCSTPTPWTTPCSYHSTTPTSPSLLPTSPQFAASPRPASTSPPSVPPPSATFTGTLRSTSP